MTAPINPHVPTNSRHIAADAPPADPQRSASAANGSADPDDTGQSNVSDAVSVDVRGAVGAENQAAATSVPEHIDAATALLSSLQAQIADDPDAAKAAHANVSNQAALSLLV